MCWSWKQSLNKVERKLHTLIYRDHSLTSSVLLFLMDFAVDDAYILIGSANVNQRSMDGQRDTEIAIGCYQSQNDRNNTNPNDIQAYRMSLWYEHTSLAEQTFLQPQSLECVQTIYSLGEAMWKIYSGEEVVDLEGVHLVNYPVNITKDGVVEDLVDGDGNFPDTKTPVKGRRSKVLPPIFTT